MKNKSYIGVSFIVLVFGIWVVNELRQRSEKEDGFVKTDRLNVPGQKETSEDLLVKIGPVPAFSLSSHREQTISNKEMLGKVYLVEFFFSTCPTICPKMNQNMLILEKHFSNENDFGIVSITINPDYDTISELNSHAEHLGVSSSNWHFLTGDKEYIFDLSNKGFNLYAGQNDKEAGGFEHSGLFALVDKKGNIRSRKDDFGNPIVYYDGLEDSGIEALKQDIRVLLQEN